MPWKDYLKVRHGSSGRRSPSPTPAPSSSSNPDAKYGLHQLYPAPSDSVVAAAATTTAAVVVSSSSPPMGPDIVAVHGLNGDPYATWTHDNDKLWLRDFVPESLPSCRVFTFGYSSEVAFTRSRTSIDDFARSLLNGVDRVRREQLQDRPLIFICHSLGGIVVKRALIVAQLDSNDYGRVQKAIAGIVFLGTPHNGSTVTPFPALLAKVANVALAGSARWTGGIRDDLVDALKRDSGQLQEIAEGFRNRILGIGIVSCLETMATPPFREPVVDRNTGRLNVPGEVFLPMDGCDHRTICRFADAKSENYLNVLARIEDIYREKKAKLIEGRAQTDAVKKPERFTVLPFARDVTFIGREEILMQLEAALTDPRSVQSAGIWGLGGIGKSQIAIEFTYRLMDKHADMSVYWVHASSVARFYESYRDISDAAEIPGRDDASADILRLVHRWLTGKHSGRWCLVLDNLDDVGVLDSPLLAGNVAAAGSSSSEPAALRAEIRAAAAAESRRTVRSCIPRCANGAVLVTSRFRDAAHGVVGDYNYLFEVDRMTEADGVRLLRTKLSPSPSSSSPFGARRAAGSGNAGDDEAADATLAAQAADLVRALDGVPLAITQAAAYISRLAPRMTLQRYVREFRRSDSTRLTLLEQSAADLRRDAEVPNAVVTTWALSFRQLVAQHAEAAELLALMSVLDNAGIPEFLVRPRAPKGAAAGAGNDEDGDDDSQQLVFEDRLHVLVGFAMVTLVESNETIRMHPLVQLAMRRWLSRNGELARWQRQALRLLEERFPQPEHKNLPACRMLLPHAELAASFAVDGDEGRLQQAKLLSSLSLVLHSQGKYDAAEPLNGRALEGHVKVLGAEHPDTLSVVHNRGLVLAGQGKYAAAEVLLRQALTGQKKALGAEHPESLAAVANLATVLLAQGKYDAAEPLFRRALEQRKKTHGAEHPETLTIVVNLACLEEDRGNYAVAEALNRHVLEGREKTLGNDHPDTLASLINLAAALQHQDKREAAEVLLRRAMSGCDKELGADHPSTLMTLSNLAALLRDQGKYGEAEVMSQRVLERRKGVLGADHPDTLMSLANVATVHLRQGRYQEAEPLYRQVLEGREKVLGAAHPDTLTTVSDLAAVLHDQGKLDAAEVLNRQALGERERVLGAEHPDTLASLDNLSLVLKDQGKYAASEEASRRALAGREKFLGPNALETLSCCSNLALTLQVHGKYEDAEELNRRALRGYEKVVGPDHPIALEIATYLATTLEGQAKFGAAEELYRRTLEQQEKALCSDHPSTLGSVACLAGTLKEQGKYDEAEVLTRRALDGLTQALGADHRNTLLLMSDYAEVLAAQGDYDTAEAILHQTLEKTRALSGDDHPSTRARLYALSSVLQEQGKYAAAEELSRRALSGFERDLGVDHPHTLFTKSVLVAAVRGLGRYDVADEMGRQVLEGKEVVFGVNHPSTLRSVATLGLILLDNRQYDTAEQMILRAMKGREKVLGTDHPDTLTSKSDFASLRQAQGRFDEAASLYRQVLEGRRKVLRAKHPRVLESMSSLAKVLRHIGQEDEADELCSQLAAL